MYENGNVDEITLMPKKIMEPRELNVFFMLEVYKNWDEDLIWEAINLVSSNYN
mgnify:CR=1 FL=1|jgi:hypothetical protein